MATTLESLLLAIQVFHSLVSVAFLKDDCYTDLTTLPMLYVCLFSEGHPDVIGSDGVATLEAYQSDLAYLKRKVLLPLPSAPHYSTSSLEV